jgi:hypothetical protein
MNNNVNRQRAFAELVSIDAWHEPFSETCRSVSLHVDATFATARVGGEIESPIRFKLSIKRAEVVVIVPETEPLRVDANSVSRDTRKVDGKKTSMEYTETATETMAKGGASFDFVKPAGSAGAEASRKGAKKKTVSKVSEEKLLLMCVEQRLTPEGNYFWIVSPEADTILHGKPWKPLESF